MGWNVNNKYVGEAAREQLAKYSPGPGSDLKAPKAPKKEPVYRMEIVGLGYFVSWLRAMATQGHTVTSIKMTTNGDRGVADFVGRHGMKDRTMLPEGVFLNKVIIG